MTLLMVAVISLLVFTAMQQNLLYLKSIGAMEVQHNRFYHLESIARHLLQVKIQDNLCVKTGDDANQTVLQLEHNKGCSVDNGAFQFQYLLEELGDFACLIVKTQKHTFSTHHRRLSILLVSDGQPNSLLQLREITAIPLQTCVAEQKEVALGISSWRYLSSLDEGENGSK